MAVFPDPTALPAIKEHLLQFYETDTLLLDTLSAFIGTGLRTGETCLLFATKVHHEDLQARLTENGVDVRAALTRGDYIWLDATDALSKIMLDGTPNQEQFAGIVGDVVARATRDQRPVRI